MASPEELRDHDASRGWYLVGPKADLALRYDIAWAMDNWTLDALTWVLSAVQYVRAAKGVRYVVGDTSDYLAASRDFLGDVDRQYYRQIVAAERRLWDALDLLFLVSEGVRQRVLKASGAKHPDHIMVLPLARRQLRQMPVFDRRQRDWKIALPGSMHGRNAMAFARFISHAWPAVHSARPRLGLHVFGHGTEQLAQRCARVGNCVASGKIDDFDAMLSRHLLAVVPADSPGGVKTIAIDALAAGTPVIASGQTLRHLGLVAGPAVLRADKPSEYAEAIIRWVGSSATLSEDITLHLNAELARYRWENDFHRCLRQIHQRILQEFEARVATHRAPGDQIHAL